MIVYIVLDKDLKKWTLSKDGFNIKPIKSNKGYFLTSNLVDDWGELDWNSLDMIYLTDKDFIHEEVNN